MDKITIRCSFCARTEAEAKRLITGIGVAICDECVETCSEMLRMPVTLEAGDRPGASANLMAAAA